ncbi:iron ABC transporter permease [Aureimonas fodinaquatilis]|uniref:Iron ABC transporter permease n=2 Tax=Aureimonas fodinaquatilis TaxID=2565783 RepID=A0A5B0E4M7_9HYPH|nr:iron ABC transporter permease [Aureimonas fodinaquatilis]
MAAAAIALFALMPIAALAWLAASGPDNVWPHLMANVLPRATWNTLLLLGGVGTLTGLIGCGAAWLVTAYDFPLRRHMEWALLLPLAVPTYIVAYAYLDILHPVGLFQGVIRTVLGYDSPRDFRLPDIRSMSGCILVMSLVLYPYVYITTRAMFMTQAANLIEISRTLGCSYFGAFRRVALPLARPAIAVGISLALMETLNDIGASEFLGIRTLTVSIYSQWVNRTDLAGASQIALSLLVLVVLLVALERWARRRQNYALSAQRPRRLQPLKLPLGRGLLALLAVSVPVTFGFVFPALYLVSSAWRRIEFIGISPAIIRETINTVVISAAGTALALLCGLIVAFAARLISSRLTQSFTRIALVGYAVPGTVLAIGILYPVTLFDRGFDTVWHAATGGTFGLLLLGSGTALVLAYSLRFMAISTGGIESGFSRIPTSLDGAARTLGASPMRMLGTIHIPLSRTAIAAAAILIFVDCMKELPATLLLRPLNFETLATHLYGEAARGTYEDASIAALLIVLVGMLPVAILSRIGRSDR